MTEEDLFSSGKLPYIAPERRHGQVRWEDIDLIEESDIKGVVHAHSTWSDGINSLAEMAESSRKKGYEYLVITDHSKAAFYANGLTEERVKAQWGGDRYMERAKPRVSDFKGHRVRHPVRWLS
jgi:DNA polymerase (family X)